MTLSNERGEQCVGRENLSKSSANTNALSESRRQEARGILRHYPSAAAIECIDQVSPEVDEPDVAHPLPTVDSQNSEKFSPA